MEYVGALLDEADGHTPEQALSTGDERQIAYHSHCQQRTLGLEQPAVDLLERLGYDVETSSVECCGMAGSFGYKSEYYELSMEVGRELEEQFRDAAEQGRSVVASGVSCQEQLQDCLQVPVVHPIQLIAPGS
jgi:Fe-S oxidoreductase